MGIKLEDKDEESSESEISQSEGSTDPEEREQIMKRQFD